VDEGVPPPGANVECGPTAEHLYPVVLVHGTFETMEQNWVEVSPRLKQECYRAPSTTATAGSVASAGRPTGSIFVDKVLDYTGAKNVSIVGHSQGGMMPRYWTKYLGGKGKVEDLVGFAPSKYGTNLGKATSENPTAEDFNLPVENNPDGNNPCYSCDQQGVDSRFIRRLNAGDDTPGPGSFSQTATEDDEIIITFRDRFLRGTERTRDVILQNYYRKYYEEIVVTHQNVCKDPVAQEFMLDALDNPGPVNPDRAPENVELPP